MEGNREGGKRNSYKNPQLLYGSILLDIYLENKDFINPILLYMRLGHCGKLVSRSKIFWQCDFNNYHGHTPGSLLDSEFYKILIGGKIKIPSESINYFIKIYTLNYLEVNGSLCIRYLRLKYLKLLILHVNSDFFINHIFLPTFQLMKTLIPSLDMCQQGLFIHYIYREASEVVRRVLESRGKKKVTFEIPV